MLVRGVYLIYIYIYIIEVLNKLDLLYAYAYIIYKRNIM
jgi:hypothetical protein